MTPKFFSPFVLFAILILAGSTFAVVAFASSETHLALIGGEGVNVISGYEITDVHYQSGNDASQIDSVSFTSNTTATLVKIKLVSTQSKWYDCHSPNGINWMCDTSGATIQSANELTVVASNQ